MSEQALEASGARSIPNPMAYRFGTPTGNVASNFVSGLSRVANRISGVAFTKAAGLIEETLDFRDRHMRAVIPVIESLQKLSEVTASIGLIGSAIDKDSDTFHRMYRESLRTKGALLGIKELGPMLDETSEEAREKLASPDKLMDFVYGKGRDNFDEKAKAMDEQITRSVRKEMRKVISFPGYTPGRKRR